MWINTDTPPQVCASHVHQRSSCTPDWCWIISRVITDIQYWLGNFPPICASSFLSYHSIKGSNTTIYHCCDYITETPLRLWGVFRMMLVCYSCLKSYTLMFTWMASSFIRSERYYLDIWKLIAMCCRVCLCFVLWIHSSLALSAVLLLQYCLAVPLFKTGKSICRERQNLSRTLKSRI